MSETQPIDQAPVQSIEDRIAAQFGLGDDEPRGEADYDGRPVEAQGEEPEEPETPAEPEDVEVEYDGERFRVPKKLEKAILQERDYTQKTQALAEQRRQIEHAQKALEASRLEREFNESVSSELQQVQLLDNYLQQLKSVDVNQLPMEEGFKHWMQMQQLKEQRDTIQKTIESKRGEHASKVKQHLETLKTQARDVLSKQITGFSEETAKQIADHAKSLGYTDADVEMIQLDPRAASLLYKSMRYDQLQATKGEAVAKAAAPVIKPGASNPMPQGVKDKLAYNKALKTAKTPAERAAIVQRRIENMKW